MLVAVSSERVVASVHGLHCINPSAAESGHTIVVIEGRVDAVSTNGVDGELLKEGNITLAAVGVSEWILEAGRLPKGIVSTGNDEA
jgi:hypothetical protein